MKTRLAPALAPVAAGLLLACSATGRSAEPAITAEGIARHLAVLADDSLAGRGTGQPGYRQAAAYVADQFRAIGLEPGGVDGSYFQPIRFRESALAPGGASVALGGGRAGRLTPGADFVASPSLRDSVLELTGPVVFVGFGVSAPELGYDDYADLDVKGKVVAVLFGGPPSLPPNPRAHLSGAEKLEVAARRGAAGMIALWSPDQERAGMAWSFVERLSYRSQMSWLEPDGSPPADRPAIPTGATLSPAASAGLFDGAPTTFAAALEAARAGRPLAVELPVSVRVSQRSTWHEVEASNVIARLPGSDPALADEYVVFTAHLDHDGIGPAIAGDSIYNGAIDNAAGVAALLEIARAFAMERPRPKRSLLFIATAAEEKGLLGADYFTSHPTVPIGSIVADLNMDGNHLLFPTRSIVALGAEMSSLGDDAAAAAAATGLELETELMPEQAFFVRSDQYPFVKKGVPSLFFINGTESSDSTIDGPAVLSTWLATVYHTPKDDLDQAMDYLSGARYAEVVFRVGARVANAPTRPSWTPGDFFGERFGKGRSTPPTQNR
ncbi:MAG: M28 family metallopeptidase [Gemmatimonadales bacterium]